MYDGVVLAWLMETSGQLMANNEPPGSIYDTHKTLSFVTKGNKILTAQAPAKEGSLAKLTLSYNTLIPNGLSFSLSIVIFFRKSTGF